MYLEKAYKISKMMKVGLITVLGNKDHRIW